jgi:NodT family efflux transporter outer membrane factor (OMF) lipoprotein
MFGQLRACVAGQKDLRTKVASKAARSCRLVAALMGFGLVPMLSGCITADRPDLGLGIPQFYRAAPKLPPAPPPALDWWRGFRSKELTDLIEEAHTANFDIAVAVARIVQADAQSKIIGAPLLPSADLNMTTTRTRASQANGGGGGSESVSYRAALSASYELDVWGKNRALSRGAQQNAIAARFDRDVVNLSAIVSVATAYFLVVSSQERLRLARQNVAAAESVLNLIKQRQEAGTAGDFEIAQQETLVASQRAQIPLIDQVLRQNSTTLALLIGRAPSFLKVRGGSLYGLGLPRVSPGLPSELIYQRPDIRAAEALLAASDANVEAARAAFFPSITLTGQYGVLSSALKNLFTPQAIFYQIAANLTQPIFDGWRLEGQLEQAKGRQVELLNLYRKTIVSGFVDVENALIAVADAAERERLQQQVVNSSRRAFDLGNQRFAAGTSDLVALLIIQQSLFTSQDNLIDARLARLQAVLSLFQALGGSWLPPPGRGQAAANR